MDRCYRRGSFWGLSKQRGTLYAVVCVIIKHGLLDNKSTNQHRIRDDRLHLCTRGSWRVEVLGER